MAKLKFFHGVMGSSKTANALMTKFNFEEKGYSVVLLKPIIDNREGELFVTSRIGLKSEAIVIRPDNNIWDVLNENCYLPSINYIIVDEVQFFTSSQIMELRYLVDRYDISVFCYGLRTDFQSHLFEGSKRLLEIADDIIEIKSLCECGRKANINSRIDSLGNVIYNGEQIEIGGNEKYISLCFKCWNTKSR